MATQPTGNTPGTPSPAPKTRRIWVKLSELVLRPEEFCHREADALNPANLKPLIESIKAEGLKHPPEVFTDKGGNIVVVAGNRRVTSLRHLAREGVAGYALDMEIEVIELLGATEQELLVWSVEDNETRANLTSVERLRAARKLAEAGVPDDRAATALGISTKTYMRDLALARHDWLVGHVAAGCVGVTVARELVEAAEKAERVPEL